MAFAGIRHQNGAVVAKANVVSDDLEPLVGDSNDAVGISWWQRKALAFPVDDLVANSAALVWPAADAAIVPRCWNKIAPLSTRTSTSLNGSRAEPCAWLVF